MTQKIGRHHRAPWRATDPSHVWVHCRWDKLKGTSPFSEEAQVRYCRAKSLFDMEAAYALVDQCMSEAAVELLVDAVIEADQPPLIVAPHPEYDDEGEPDAMTPRPSNAIPFAFADRLADQLDCEIDNEIIEVARPGRSKLTNFQRFKWQPAFTGAIRSDRSYIIVDDVCTVAGTLAMLRSYIVEQGGTVIGATTLAHNHGCHQIFPIAAGTLGMLKSLYSDGIVDLWKEEIGHGVESLTENEALRLLEWGNERRVSAGHASSVLRLLRDRLSQVSEKGS